MYCTLFIKQEEEAVIEFYRARISYFYSGQLDQVDFKQLDVKIGQSTEQMIASKTNNDILNFMQGQRIPLYLPPLIAFGANFFQV